MCCCRCIPWMKLHELQKIHSIVTCIKEDLSVSEISDSVAAVTWVLKNYSAFEVVWVVKCLQCRQVKHSFHLAAEELTQRTWRTAVEFDRKLFVVGLELVSRAGGFKVLVLYQPKWLAGTSSSISPFSIHHSPFIVIVIIITHLSDVWFLWSCRSMTQTLSNEAAGYAQRT